MPVVCKLAVNFNPINIQGSKLTEGDVTPFRAIRVTIQDGVSKKQILAIVFSDVPVAAEDKKVKIDELVFQGG